LSMSIKQLVYTCSEDATVLYEGEKTLRSNISLEVLLISYPKLLCVELIAFDSKNGSPLPRLYMSTLLLLTIIDMDRVEKKMDMHRAICDRKLINFDEKATQEIVYNELMVSYILFKLTVSTTTERVNKLDPNEPPEQLIMSIGELSSNINNKMSTNPFADLLEDASVCCAQPAILAHCPTSVQHRLSQLGLLASSKDGIPVDSAVVTDASSIKEIRNEQNEVDEPFSKVSPSSSSSIRGHGLCHISMAELFALATEEFHSIATGEGEDQRRNPPRQRWVKAIKRVLLLNLFHADSTASDTGASPSLCPSPSPPPSPSPSPSRQSAIAVHIHVPPEVLPEFQLLPAGECEGAGTDTSSPALGVHTTMLDRQLLNHPHQQHHQKQEQEQKQEQQPHKKKHVQQQHPQKHEEKKKKEEEMKYKEDKKASRAAYSRHLKSLSKIQRRSIDNSQLLNARPSTVRVRRDGNNNQRGNHNNITDVVAPATAAASCYARQGSVQLGESLRDTRRHHARRSLPSLPTGTGTDTGSRSTHDEECSVHTATTLISGCSRSCANTASGYYKEQFDRHRVKYDPDSIDSLSCDSDADDDDGNNHGCGCGSGSGEHNYSGAITSAGATRTSRRSILTREDNVIVLPEIQAASTGWVPTRFTGSSKSTTTINKSIKSSGSIRATGLDASSSPTGSSKRFTIPAGPYQRQYEYLQQQQQQQQRQQHRSSPVPRRVRTAVATKMVGYQPTIHLVTGDRSAWHLEKQKQQQREFDIVEDKHFVYSLETGTYI